MVFTTTKESTVNPMICPLAIAALSLSSVGLRSARITSDGGSKLTFPVSYDGGSMLVTGTKDGGSMIVGSAGDGGSMLTASAGAGGSLMSGDGGY
jgi:hypothetical protein